MDSPNADRQPRKRQALNCKFPCDDHQSARAKICHVKGSLLTFDTGSSERGEKSFVIEVVAEDWFTVIAPIHNVIDRVGILDAQRTQHGPTLPNIRVSVNSKERPLYVVRNFL